MMYCYRRKTQFVSWKKGLLASRSITRMTCVCGALIVQPLWVCDFFFLDGATRGTSIQRWLCTIAIIGQSHGPNTPLARTADLIDE
jgi:hypothetical protein